MSENDERLGFHGNPRNIQYTSKAARLLNQTESGVARAASEESENFLERQYGRLLMAIDLDFTSDFYDVSEVLADTFEREFYADLNRTVQQSFEHALTATNQTLAELAAEGQNAWVGKLNATVAAIHDNQVVISQTGNAAGFLVRGPTITEITEGLSGDAAKQATAKTFLNVASGELEVGDKILLATGELAKRLSKTDIRRHLYLHPPPRAIRRMADQLTNAGSFGPLAGVVAELTTIDLISAETVSGDPEEIILGAPRGHFETLQRFKPFKADTPIGEAVAKARKHWERRLQPAIRRQLGGLRGKATTYQARRRGEAPPAPPPKPAAGTPETSRTDQPGRRLADRVAPAAATAGRHVGSVWQRIRPIVGRILHPVKRLLRQAWEKSGISRTPAWTRIRRALEPIRRFLRKIPGAKWLSGNRSAIYRNLIIVIGLILLISLAMSVNAAQTRKKENDVRARIKGVEALQAKAEASFIFKDVAGARQQVAQAKSDADALGKEKVLSGEVGKLQQTVQGSYDRINNVVAVPDQPVADFATVSPGTEPKNLAQSGTTLYAIPDTGPILTYSQPTKEAKVANPNPGLAGNVRSAGSASNGDVFLLTDKPTVYLVDAATSQVAEQPVGTGGSWESGVSVDTVQQNLFILEADKNQIWRHARTLSAFNKGEPYLTAEVDLRGAVDLATGSQVFVLKQDGALLAFSEGAKQNFSLTGTPAPQDKLIEPRALAVNFSNQNIYIADPKERRVLEYTGSGQYSRQFRNAAFANTQDIQIDDKTNNLFVVAGTKLFQINLSG